MRRTVEAVLLDVDGTLVDSNDAHARAWVDVGQEFGYPIRFEEVRRLIGMGGDRVLPRLTGLEEESAEGAPILERRGEIFRTQYLPGLRRLPGARELLERLRNDGRRLVIATSASDEDLKAMLRHLALEDLVDAATNADAADASKPAPDIVEAALKKSGAASPDAAVMLGDTPYDVTAAHRAGVRIIALRSGGWSDEELHGAAGIYDDPADLLAHYDATPLAR